MANSKCKICDRPKCDHTPGSVQYIATLTAIALLGGKTPTQDSALTSKQDWRRG